MKLDENTVSKLVIEKQNNGWDLTTHTSESISSESLGDNLDEVVCMLALKCYKEKWKHEPERFEQADKDRIVEMFKESIENIKKHMEYVIDNFYTPDRDDEVE